LIKSNLRLPDGISRLSPYPLDLAVRLVPEIRKGTLSDFERPVHGNHFEGLLSDLAIFRVALTAEQIRQIMGGDFHLPQEKP
jgi:hypothetical protein